MSGQRPELRCPFCREWYGPYTIAHLCEASAKADDAALDAAGSCATETRRTGPQPTPTPASVGLRTLLAVDGW